MNSYLRLSVTDRCELGCIYCMPARGAILGAGEPLGRSEIAALVRAFARNGVTKVRLTGGEPLARRDIVSIVEVVARAPGIRALGLTTNGIGLAACARDLKAAGLGLVNISLDSLDRRTYAKITGRDALDEVWRGIDAALECGFERVKLNTVLMRGVNDSQVAEIAEIANSMPVEVRFIELMPIGHESDAWRAMRVPAAEIRERLEDIEPIATEIGSSARRFKLKAGGIVGIISPVSEDFCAGCNRIRVTCTGKLRPCLRLPVEEDIRPLIGRPDLASRLGTLMDKLSGCKLSGPAPPPAVEAEAMCSVGG